MGSPIIAIYGATGHTGRLVAAALLARGHEIVLAGRDADGLRAVADDLGEHTGTGAPRTQVAALDDAAALRELAEAASVLVHCAGPFSVTGEPVATAAVAAGCHYVDHAVESHHVRRLFADFHAPARQAGIVMIPGMSFYGGLGDLLAAAVTEGAPGGASSPAGPPGSSGFDRVTVAYAVTGWRLTTGAKNTAAQLFAETERITFTDGAFHVGFVEPRNAVFPFPPPLGPRTMIAPLPSCDVVTIPRHVPVRHVEAQLTAGTFTEEQAFTSEDADPHARAGTEFTVAVQAIAEGGGGRAGQVVGRDLWRAGALASVEAAVRLAGGRGPARSGVLAPAEAFAATELLRTLERQKAFTVQVGGDRNGDR